MTIKNIKSINTLSTKEMSNVKGGNRLKAIINAGIAAYNPNATDAQNLKSITTAVAGVVADDKRPPRPGGGITTL